MRGTAPPERRVVAGSRITGAVGRVQVYERCGRVLVRPVHLRITMMVSMAGCDGTIRSAKRDDAICWIVGHPKGEKLCHLCIGGAAVCEEGITFRGRRF